MRYISALLLKQNQTRRKLASIHYRSPLPLTFALLFAKRKKEKEKTPAKNRILISERFLPRSVQSCPPFTGKFQKYKKGGVEDHWKVIRRDSFKLNS